MEKFPAITPIVIYRDVKAALDWLERAFGFETHMVISDAAGNIVHAESKFEGANVMVAPAYAAHVKSPLDMGSINTQALYVHITKDVDAHCARARAAGAKITQELQDLPYGERVYKALDPEGHSWTFSQVMQPMDHAQMAKALGMTVRPKP